MPTTTHNRQTMSQSPRPKRTVAITPFWRRIPRFFLFPAQFGPLWRMALLAAATVFRPLFPAPKPFDYLLLLGLVALAFLRYAYRVLDQTSLGHLDAERYELVEDKDKQNRPYKQWLVFMVLGYVLFTIGQFFGHFGAFVSFMLFLLCLPASVMILAVSNSMAQAMDPRLLWHLMRAVGWPYLALWFFLSFLSSGSASAFSMLLPILPQWLWLPAMTFLTMYFTLIMFNMMGYVLYEYHDRLGLEVQVDFDDNEEKIVDGEALDPRFEELTDHLLAGRLDAALRMLQEDRAAAPNSLAANERLFKLLLAGDDFTAKLDQGRRLIAVQLEQGQARAAANTFLQCRTLLPEFQMEQPRHLLLLGEALRGAGDFEAALSCLREFHRCHSHHGDMPKVVFLSARILSENLHEDGRARQVLQGFLNHFPQDPLADEVKRYLDVMSRLGGAQPAKA